MSVLDKVRKFKENRPKTGGGGRTMGIFKDWNQGENVIRLVGEFLEVRTHFIAPAPKIGSRGMCMEEAFAKDNDDKIPKVVNCPDWDVDTETEKKKKTCPICNLNRIAAQAMTEGPNDEEAKYFKTLRDGARARTKLKWNIFDRDDPNVTVVDDKGNEAKRKGLKIASIGTEAMEDIEGIFEQVAPVDITDPEEGVDIKVIKGHNGMRVEYSAQVILSGKSLKETPFDDEEKEIVARPHELKAICGKQTDMDKVVAGLHGDYKEILELNAADGGEDEEEEAPAPAKSKATKVDEVDEDEEGEVDEDALLDGTSAKKK